MWNQAIRERSRASSESLRRTDTKTQSKRLNLLRTFQKKTLMPSPDRSPYTKINQLINRSRRFVEKNSPMISQQNS